MQLRVVLKAQIKPDFVILLQHPLTISEFPEMGQKAKFEAQVALLPNFLGDAHLVPR